MKSTSAVLQGMREQEGPPPAVDIAVRLPLADMEDSAMVIIQCAEMTWGGTPVRCREQELIGIITIRQSSDMMFPVVVKYLICCRRGMFVCSC